MANKYKILVISSVIFVLALGFWLFLEPWLDSSAKFSKSEVWWLPLAMLVILTAVNGIGLILIRKLLHRVCLALLIGVAFLIIFDFNPLYPGTFSTLILLELYAGRVLDDELSNRVKINIKSTLRRGLPWLITPLLIMISFVFYQSPSVQAHAQAGQLPPTVKQVIEKMVTIFLGKELKTLPPKERQETERQVINLVTERLTGAFKPYFKYTPPILAFGLFLVLQGLSVIFVWLAVLAGMLLFWLIKKADFIRIVQREVKIEAVEFS